MIRIFGLFLCGTLIFAGAQAWAETWIPLAQGGGASLALDKDSVTLKDGRTHYVSRMLYLQPQTLTDEAEKPVSYIELRNQMDMDCLNRLQSPLAGRFYDPSGKMVAEILTPEQPRPIITGSSADWEYRAVCPVVDPVPAPLIEPEKP